VTSGSSDLRIEVFEDFKPQDEEPAPMSQKPIGKLRRRMLEDMAARKFSEATIRTYPPHRGVSSKSINALFIALQMQPYKYVCR
jgi:hypothetical protein